MRVRFDLAYEGTGYAGWARQPDQRTVQGVLEDALRTVLRLPESPSLTVAGRTDAGVHARGQVAHSDLDDVPPIRWLNRLLPDDVRLWSVTAASPGFDARFSALSRRYSYRVTDGPVDPLRRRDTLAWGHPLDLAAMNAAAESLMGEHDFAAYCKRREGATTIRRLLALSWSRAADGVLEARVEADAFCHSMVRALVGALLTVGEGRRPPEWPGQVLAAAVRDSAVPVVPAHGLCLEEVHYPPDAQLAARASATRRVRVLGTDPGDESPGSIR
jgi:tRNA pseudouridine38-40 synthase